MKIHCQYILPFLVKALPPSFRYNLDIFIFCYTFYKVKIDVKRSVPVLKLPKTKCIIPSSGIYLLLYPIYFELYGPFFTKCISIFNFAYIATTKSRVSAENIAIKVSALSLS